MDLDLWLGVFFCCFVFYNKFSIYWKQYIYTQRKRQQIIFAEIAFSYAINNGKTRFLLKYIENKYFDKKLNDFSIFDQMLKLNLFIFFLSCREKFSLLAFFVCLLVFETSFMVYQGLEF